MIDCMVHFARDQTGQDMVEYALLLVFIVITSAALLLSNNQAISAIWSVTNANLSKAEHVIQ